MRHLPQCHAPLLGLGGSRERSPISAIVMAKMLHNTNPFSRALKQTMITEKRSLNALASALSPTQESLEAAM
ncbi:hypothetical protein MHYP_G00178550 [Metynnis hypsauchen]